MRRPTQHDPCQSAPAGPFDSGLYMLYLAAFPLLLLIFQGSLPGMLAALFQLGLFALALWFIWTGQKVQDAYDAAEAARKPRVPRKLVGCGLIGLLVLILAGMQFTSILAPLGLALTAMSLAIAAFGTDPMQDKGFDNPAVILRQRAAELTEQVRIELDEIVADVAALDDDDLTRRTEATRSAICRLLRLAAFEPLQMRALRKPTRRFLDLLTDETDKLCTDWNGPRHAFARRRFVAKMAKLTACFENKARQCGLGGSRDVFDLEADLLIDRMENDLAA